LKTRGVEGLRGGQFAEFDGAELGGVAVIGEHEVAAEFLAEVGVFREFAFGDAGRTS